MNDHTATMEEDPFAILGETLDTAADSLESTTANARASAHRAAAATKRVVGSGAYSLSYALAYGAVFTATYLHDLMPGGSAVQRGFNDGAHDALEARQRRHTLREPHAEAAPAPESHHQDASRAGSASKAAKRPPVARKARQAVDRRAEDFEDRM